MDEKWTVEVAPTSPWETHGWAGPFGFVTVKNDGSLECQNMRTLDSGYDAPRVVAIFAPGMWVRAIIETEEP